MDTDNTPFGGKIMFSAESETGGAASDKAPAKSQSEKASAKNANGKGADAVEAPPHIRRNRCSDRTSATDQPTLGGSRIAGRNRVAAWPLRRAQTYIPDRA